jgi:hypothetical protein
MGSHWRLRGVWAAASSVAYNSPFFLQKGQHSTEVDVSLGLMQGSPSPPPPTLSLSFSPNSCPRYGPCRSLCVAGDYSPNSCLCWWIPACCQGPAAKGGKGHPWRGQSSSVLPPLFCLNPHSTATHPFATLSYCYGAPTVPQILCSPPLRHRLRVKFVPQPCGVNADPLLLVFMFWSISAMAPRRS